MASIEDMGIHGDPEQHIAALRGWADAVEITEAGAAARVMREAAEVFENCFVELDGLKAGRAVVMPADAKHAQAMIAVAQSYLDHN